jgi:hypothetical protein
VDQTILEREALKLPAYERALWADSLIKSLDEEATHEVESTWAQEAEKRLDACQRGEIQAVDGPALIAELRARFTK